MSQSVFNYHIERIGSAATGNVPKSQMLAYIQDMRTHIINELNKSEKLYQLQQELLNHLDEVARFIQNSRDKDKFISDAHEQQFRDLMGQSNKIVDELKAELKEQYGAEHNLLKEYDKVKSKEDFNTYEN